MDPGIHGTVSPGQGFNWKRKDVVRRVGMLADGAKICGGAGKLVWTRGEMCVAFSTWVWTSQ